MLRDLKRWVFARHANPISAWSRWASTPLVLLPIWTRRWSYASAVAAWMVANAVIFPKPQDDVAWATRAMLGEELWIDHRPRDVAMAINVAAAGFGVCAALSAWRRMAGATTMASVAEMALLLAYWQRMVSYYEHDRWRSGSDHAGVDRQGEEITR